MIYLFLVLSLILKSSIAVAQDEKSIQMATGFNFMVQSRTDYGANSHLLFFPEIVTYAYYHLSENYYLRPGVRLGTNVGRAEMPQSVKIIEDDYRFSGELGVTFDWFIIPSVSVGIGNIYRTIKLDTSPPITVENEKISQTENLIFHYVQLGVGVSLIKGFVVIEPNFRFESVAHDPRIKWNYGLEATIQLF